MPKNRRQRGSVIQKGRFYFGYFRDKQGKQKWIGEKPGHGFKTHGEARRRLNEILVEIDRGSYVNPKGGSFAQFAEEWLAGRLSIEGGTLSAYASIIRKHLIPSLGELEVAEIELHHVQNLATALAGRLSSKTIGNIMTLLNTMLDGKFGQSAVKVGYIRHNPAKGIELPPDHGEEIIPPTADQVSLLINAAREIGGIAYAIVLLAASTGMRRGEILALRYCDIDWFSSELLIRQAIKKAKATDGVHKWQWKLGAPKSRKSGRRIGLTETARSLLAGLKELNGGDDLIFTKGMVDLKPPAAWIDPDYFDASLFGPIADKAGLSGMRFHDLRHFFASVLIAQRESAKYVQDQMGHSSIQVTFDTYGHLFPQAKQDSVRRLDATLTAALSSKSLGSEKSSTVERKRASKNDLLETLLETDRRGRPEGTPKSRTN
jgi:integrase